MKILESLVEVQLKNSEDFLKVKETLTRIGIASSKTDTLYQSCHVLHKRGKYYLVHFKEMFMLDGKTNNFGDEDKRRRDAIVTLLEEWNLLDIVDENFERVRDLKGIKVIPFKQKSEWNLVTKYNIGS